MRPPPLQGLRVLDLTRLLPGPYATLVLADLGAEIIKIEAPGGGDYARWYPPLGGRMSALFAALNRNKRGVVLNLKQPDGPAILRRLVQRADVLFESFRPGVMDRLGVGYDALKTINPGLIYCAITGYGQEGPLADQAGHDLNYLALSGLLGTTGRAGEVIQPGFQAADVAGGALYGVIGVLAALHARDRSGEGAFIDAAMTDGVAGLGIMMHARQALAPAELGPGQDELAGDRLCYRVYRCADGKHLAVGALEPKFWATLCAAIGAPHLATDGLATGARRDGIQPAVEALFASRTRDAWVAHLASSDVCVSPVLSLEEVRRSPQAEARGWFGQHDHPSEGATFLHQHPNPALVRDHPPPPVQPAPTMGADTREVLTAAGCSADEIAAWAAAGAIGLGS